MKTCQVCGNLLFNENYMGHNSDGSVNEDFCSACFKNGHFTNEIGPSGEVGIFFPIAFNDASNPE